MDFGLKGVNNMLDIQRIKDIISAGTDNSKPKNDATPPIEARVEALENTVAEITQLFDLAQPE